VFLESIEGEWCHSSSLLGGGGATKNLFYTRLKKTRTFCNGLEEMKSYSRNMLRE